ncbi:MAG: hypothetical protein ACM37W_22935 [Actinomycetota bacterium]
MDKRKRLNLTIPEWVHRGLKQLVAAYGTTIQDWMEEMVANAVVEGGFAKRPHNYSSIAELVKANYSIISETRIPAQKLVAIRDGAKPSELDLVRIAAALGLDENYLIELCHQSFPNDCKQEVQTNRTT